MTVTNTGETAGKDVVELYFNPPYQNGGIEKATANLLQFAKNRFAAAWTVPDPYPFPFAAEDMASFDYMTERAYALEAGDYILSVKQRFPQYTDQKEYQVSQTKVYNQEEKRESDQIAAVNVFDEAAGDVVYLSRADRFANMEKAIAAR